MADSITEVKPAEIIGFHEGQKVADLTSLPESFRVGVDKARKLRELQQKGRSGQETFIEAKRTENEKVEPSQVEDMKSAFGAGFTKLDANGKVELDTDKLVGRPDSDVRLIKESFESGRKAIEGIVSYLSYADVVTEAYASGKNPVDILKNSDPRADATTWTRIKETAINTLIQTGAVQKIYPEFSTLSQAVQKDVMDKMIASDPELRKKIAGVFRDRETELLNLPKLESNSDLTAAREAEKSNKAKKGEKIESSLQQINDLGLGLDETELREEIKRRIDEGRSAESIAAYLQDRLLKLDPDYAHIIALPQLKEEYNKALNDAKGTNAANNSQEYREARAKELEEAKKRYDQSNQIKSNLGEGYNDKLKKIQTIASLTNSTKDAGGSYSSQLLQELGDAVKANKDLKLAENIIKENEEEGNKVAEQSLRRRLRKEAEVTSGLEDDLHNAILDTLTERVDKVIELKSTQDTKDYTKEEEEAVGKVKKGMEESWIRYEKGKRRKQVKSDQIAKDMKVVTYEGKDGIKRLMLRDMGVANWDSVELSSLDDKTKKLLEKAYMDEGANYQATLLKDFFLARSSSEALSLGKLNLKEHEWEMLETNFGGDLEKALAESKAAQGILEKLKESGVIPTRGIKWLLFLLLGIKRKE